MSEAAQPARRVPRGGVALAFAVAAVLACWNPLAAPLGLLVGVVALMLSLSALRRAGGRRTAALGVALSALSIAASIVVLLRTAGAVGVDLPGEQVVQGRTQADLDRVLGEAAERTRARRERAAQELDALPGGDSHGRDGGTPDRARPPAGGGSPSGR